MEISNDTPISDITDDASNSSHSMTAFEPKSSEDKEMNNFLDSTYKEKVSKEIIQNIKEKKFRDQEKIIASQDTKSSLSVKGRQGLIQELFTSEPSLQESNIIQNHVTEISEIGGPRKSNIDEASQYLAQL
ncbi:5618_t:CDS:2, partial [Acaulospora morrowiae]